MNRDLRQAGIPKWTPEGKLDFHAARVAYTTFLFECGASIIEAQALARHSSPVMTANVYGRTRRERLAEVAEKVGAAALPIPERAICVPEKDAGAEAKDANSFSSEGLSAQNDCGGRGTRTPKPLRAADFKSADLPISLALRISAPVVARRAGPTRPRGRRRTVSASPPALPVGFDLAAPAAGGEPLTEGRATPGGQSTPQQAVASPAPAR